MEEKPKVEEKKEEAKPLSHDGSNPDLGEPKDPVPEPPLDDNVDGEPKAPTFDFDAHEWTATNKQNRNMPQLFKDFKGKNCQVEEHASSKYSDVTQEAVVKAMDEFCASILKNHNSKYIY